MRTLSALLVLMVLAGCQGGKPDSAAPGVVSNKDSTLNFSGSNLRGQSFVRKDLSNADFTNADLSRANLAETNLEGADFSGALLAGVRSGAISGTPRVLPQGWRLVNGYLVGPGANLRHAVLTYARLDGMNLDEVDFTAANLLYASFRGSSLVRTTIVGAKMFSSDMDGSVSRDLQGIPETLPRGWKLKDGEFSRR